MSFYAGPVARLIRTTGNVWEVLSVYYLDTNCDENIQTNFIYKTVSRILILPVVLIKDFDIVLTKKVNRIFNSDSLTESWTALK